MGEQLRSGLLAGFTAGFIWMFLSNLIGGQDPKTVAWIGLIFVVSAAIITMVIAAIISRGKAGTAYR